MRIYLPDKLYILLPDELYIAIFKAMMKYIKFAMLQNILINKSCFEKVKSMVTLISAALTTITLVSLWHQLRGVQKWVLPKHLKNGSPTYFLIILWYSSTGNKISPSTFTNPWCGECIALGSAYYCKVTKQISRSHKSLWWFIKCQPALLVVTLKIKNHLCLLRG